jgi:HAD superfamily hydrolase (TIGR01549 family)
MNLPSNITCILFDLDNTLVEIPDTWHYFDEIIVKTLAEDFHLPVPNQAMRDTLWRSGKEYVKILKEWGIDDPNAFWYYFDIRDSRNRALMIQEQKLKLYLDVIPVLDALRLHKIKLGIVTNTPKFIAETELNAFGLMRYFQVVLGLGDNQAICKPEPDGVYQCLKMCDCIPSETLMVGDTAIDLVAAKRAGVGSILIDRTGKKKIIDPELIESDFIHITSLSQILHWIE